MNAPRLPSADAAAHTPRAVGVPARQVVTSLVEVGTTHVVIVPDTHQRTVLELLDDPSPPTPPVIRATTEHDVLGICAGLWMAGARPVALIQQLGLFASVNALRSITHDQKIPLAILAGMYGRDVSKTVADNPASSVTLCTPVLDALGVPWTLVETPKQAPAIATGLRRAFDEHCTSVVLLGAPTA